MTSRSRSTDPAPGDGAPDVLEREALGLLARKPATELEVRRRLDRPGRDARTIDEVVGRLKAAGYVDDSKLAADFIAARCARLGHGPERLARDLERRGVRPEVVREAWALAVRRGDVEPRALLRRQIRRRMKGREARLGPAAFARVYNALLRAGFDGATVRRELEPHRAIPDPSGDRLDDGMNDDFP